MVTICPYFYNENRMPEHVNGLPAVIQAGANPNRRQFLASFGAAGVCALLAPDLLVSDALAVTESNDESNGLRPLELPRDEHGGEAHAPNEAERPDEAHKSPEAEQHGPSMLDMVTAGAVGANFLRHVGYNGAIRGIELGPRSAAEMAALAFGRAGALQVFGGEHDRELGAEEANDIVGDLYPVPVLVGLSDLTTTVLGVDAQRIFDGVEGVIERGLDYARVQRPDLGADKAEWQTYLDGVNAGLRSKASQISAVTTTLAPIGTTYAASALSNRLKEEMMRILYEQSFAMEVLARKSSEGDRLVLGHDEIHTAAAARTDKCFNGALGFSKLVLTLSANTQGSLGVGDPPEIYFAKNHPKLRSLALGHSVGLANSLLYTILLNGMWLKSVGAFSPHALLEYVGNLKDTLVTLYETLTNGALRDVSLRSGKGAAKAIMAALGPDAADPTTEIGRIIASIPPARLSLQLDKYLADKIAALSAVAAKIHRYAVAIDESEITDPETFGGSNLFDELMHDIFAGEVDKAKRSLHLVEHSLQSSRAGAMADMFVELADEVRDLVGEDATKLDLSGTDTDPKTQHVAELAQEIIDEISGVAQGPNKRDRLANAMRYCSQAGRDGKEVFEALSENGPDTLREAIRKFVEIGGREDVVPGLDDHGDASTNVENVRTTVRSEQKLTTLAGKTLSHSAKEVLFALLTQIPSVPALRRLAEVIVPVLVGVENGDKPTPDQLKTIIWATLALEATISSSADNVAAYLFAETLLQNFFKMTFGETVLEEHPELFDWIGVITVKNAENAGNLYKLGNGPNFSQEKCEILLDESNTQGIGINRVNLPLGETLPHKNLFASTVNVTFIATASTLLCRKVDSLVQSQMAAA